MKKIKMIAVLAVCLMFGVNAFAAGHNNYNYRQPKQKAQYGHNQKNVKNVKIIKYVPPKPKPQPQVVHKTVVVHRYEEPRHNPAAEAVALVGLGIIATAVIANAVF